MPSALPDGEPAPADGTLPAESLRGLGTRPFGIYVHVPFCAVRCGYCDFNTYTALELGGGASQAAYADTAATELDLAADVLGRPNGRSCRRVDTVFFGGGTPTLLPSGDLVALLARIREPVRAPGRRRGHDRGQPRLGDCRLAGRARRGWHHPGLVRDAVSGPAASCTPSTAPTTRIAWRKRSTGPAPPGWPSVLT